MLSRLLSSFLLALMGGQVIHVATSPVQPPPPLNEANSNVTTPTAPGYTFLYSANASIADGIDFGTSPYNHRIAYPITGGEFNGPNLTGNKPLYIVSQSDATAPAKGISFPNLKPLADRVINLQAHSSTWVQTGGTMI